MRPLRFLLSLITCITAFFLLLYIAPWRDTTAKDFHEQGTIGTYFNWRTPSSLFPPSAIISLTDDNSTFFLARPAAFGPLIPAKSLSGQLWIGSGFGEDHLGRSGVEGELGCSDVPGWSDGDYHVGAGKSLSEVKGLWAAGREGKSKGSRKREAKYKAKDEEAVREDPVESDGTDDHLHHPLPPSDGSKTGGAKKATHADIQSLQESAEIAGKIVLLSRGGCGFLEKVKWVQRRGGVALIVGDDIRGGPLVTMYARGDTSNVTIPSLFTSHTTAHLLSSLIPSGGAADTHSPEEANRLGLALGGAGKSTEAGHPDSQADKAHFTTSSIVATNTHPPQQPAADGLVSSQQNQIAAPGSRGWLSSLWGRKGPKAESSEQQPDSKNVGWVLQEEFDDEEVLKYGSKRTTTTLAKSTQPTTVSGSDPADGFVIGVQDWRDPDLVGRPKEELQTSVVPLPPSIVPESQVQPSNGAVVDSITPGSGEYLKSTSDSTSSTGSKASDGQHDGKTRQQEQSQSSCNGWLCRLFGSKQEPEVVAFSPTEEDQPLQQPSHSLHDLLHKEDKPEVHEGLWVTLTPTSMSSSPLFDTLLVLVVSPLVTLTVVYALLLLRSRIRRRRWRAPKSVVERLPVRTYQTMASTTTTSSTTSSISSPVSAITPLLPSNARTITPRSRPRSRTTPEGPTMAGSSLRSDGMASPSPEQIEEKRAAGLAEWRRRYGGKQRECVVCLEEYVDGVSRVMSLPCGHEFHAECITPWLTTRRRTCPICKGDVVRSLARSAGSSSSLPPQTYQEDEDSDEVQEQAAATRNDDPAAAQPISREDEMFEDLERGPDRTR